MAIKGYKSFDVDHTNCYNSYFEEGKSYHVEGQIIYGVHGNGIHFAKRLEDTIRFSGTSETLKDVAIAEVIGDGIIVEGYDHYNGYYDLYCCSDLEVVKFLTREEIISHALTLGGFGMERFVSQFRLESDDTNNLDYDTYYFDIAILNEQGEKKTLLNNGELVILTHYTDKDNEV